LNGYEIKDPMTFAWEKIAKKAFESFWEVLRN
jgi:hypothetical protein